MQHACQHQQRSDYGNAPPAVRREDGHAYRDWKARVKVHFNESAPSVYNILRGQDKYNSTVGIKLVIVLTGLEQDISTVGRKFK